MVSISPAQPFRADGRCNSIFLSAWSPGPFWWHRMITVSLGTWTGSEPGTPYPGDENLWANEVLFFYTDGCPPSQRIEMHYGVMTDQGFTVMPDNSRSSAGWNCYAERSASILRMRSWYSPMNPSPALASASSNDFRSCPNSSSVSTLRAIG